MYSRTIIRTIQCYQSNSFLFNLFSALLKKIKKKFTPQKIELKICDYKNIILVPFKVVYSDRLILACFPFRLLQISFIEKLHFKELKNIIANI